MPKRKRSFSRILKRGAPDRKVASQTVARREEVEPNAREEEPNDKIRASVTVTTTTTSSTSKRNYTKKEYVSKLRKISKENTELKSELHASKNKLVASERKNSDIVEAQRLSLISARESKKAAADAEANRQKLKKSLREAAEDAEVLQQEHEKTLLAREEKLQELFDQKLDAARMKEQVSNSCLLLIHGIIV